MKKRSLRAFHNYDMYTILNVDHLFGSSFAQSRARIGAAVAKGMALRALGPAPHCSDFGYG